MSRCDERLKARVEESACLTYTGLHDKNKLEIPRDKDEVNKREIHECDGAIMSFYVAQTVARSFEETTGSIFYLIMTFQITKTNIHVILLISDGPFVYMRLVPVRRAFNLCASRLLCLYRF